MITDRILRTPAGGGRPAAAGLALALSLALAPPASAAVAAPGLTGIPGGGTAAVVTLVTGDRVRLSTAPDGTQRAALLPDPEDPAPGASIRTIRGHVHVVPAEARPFLAAGRLDPDLFDVTALVADGYDDAHTDAVPLLADVAVASAPAASVLRAALPEVGITVLRAPHRSARTFWARLAAPSAAPAEGFSQGVRRVWLDGRVRASLDRSVPQIGGPAAHARGLDGRGVTVAVLDTGIDEQHADLRGRVVAQRDFTDEGTTDDRHGHGTHVASIVAGTGAASSGRYRGVAPHARLLNGRVLDSFGSGTESGVLAGMVWATSHGARIVNMSLGSSSPTDGTDPLSLAVNRLSRRTGALFVVAAGNNGETGTVSSPGSADAALTVGAAERDDSLADFSSRGPRRGDSAVKPEITGPGVDIVAAQAEGTELGPVVAPGYVALSGTSMATPHVAGAAALLAQQHPGWTGQLLKAALVGTAHDTAASAYDEGGGRVAVDRAVSTTLTEDDATLDLGAYDWPHGGDPAEVRTLTYTNRGATDVELDLSVVASDGEGDRLPADALAVSPRTLRLARGESAPVRVVLEPDAAAVGTWTGALTVRGDDGSRLRAALGFTKESEHYDLAVDVLGRDGRAADTSTVDVY